MTQQYNVIFDESLAGTLVLYDGTSVETKGGVYVTAVGSLPVLSCIARGTDQLHMVSVLEGFSFSTVGTVNE